LKRDRDLVRLHWPVALRPAFDALFDIDDALAEVVERATEPTLAAIKLAWWREQLEKLDTDSPPAEPRLRAAAAELLPRGIRGKDLAALGENWWLLLQTQDQLTFMRGVASRGPLLFTLAARLLGIAMDDHLDDAAQCFAAADLGRREIFDLVPLKLRRSKVRAPRESRPLTALGVLARRDMQRVRRPFEVEATPGRSWALIWHRMTGRS
jgi:15-cis-phytoene synthase